MMKGTTRCLLKDVILHIFLTLCLCIVISEQAAIGADNSGEYEDDLQTNNVIILASVSLFVLICGAVLFVFMCGFCMNPEVSTVHHKAAGDSGGGGQNCNYNYNATTMNDVNTNVMAASTSVYGDGPMDDRALPYGLTPRVQEDRGFAGYSSAPPAQAGMHHAPENPPSYSEATTPGLSGWG